MTCGIVIDLELPGSGVANFEVISPLRRVALSQGCTNISHVLQHLLRDLPPHFAASGVPPERPAGVGVVFLCKMTMA